MVRWGKHMRSVMKSEIWGEVLAFECRLEISHYFYNNKEFIITRVDNFFAYFHLAAPFVRGADNARNYNTTML